MTKDKRKRQTGRIFDNSEVTERSQGQKNWETGKKYR